MVSGSVGESRETDRKNSRVARKIKWTSHIPSVSTPAASTCLPLRLLSRMLTHGNHTAQIEDHLADNRCDLGLGLGERSVEDQQSGSGMAQETRMSWDRDHNRPGSGWTMAQQQGRGERRRTGEKGKKGRHVTGYGVGTGYLDVGWASAC
jgi:hypothetical protein